MKLTEDELIEFLKPILKQEGFKKTGKRWTKNTGHFTYIFFIQGSSFDKDDYYVRPGIIINDIPIDELCNYGHIFINIPVTSKEEILVSAESFFAEWNDVGRLVEKVKEFIEWEERNPIEKRRANLVDYEKDPVPGRGLLSMSSRTKEQVLGLQDGIEKL